VSLRARLTLAGGGAVFVALAIASLVIYVDVRSKLHDQIDVSLIQSAQNIATKWLDANGPTSVKVPPGKPGTVGKRANNPTLESVSVFRSDASGYFQVIPSFGVALKTAARVGEAPTISSGPAVVAAIRAATGLPLNQVPVRPEHITGT